MPAARRKASVSSKQPGLLTPCEGRSKSKHQGWQGKPCRKGPGEVGFIFVASRQKGYLPSLTVLPGSSASVGAHGSLGVQGLGRGENLGMEQSSNKFGGFGPGFPGAKASAKHTLGTKPKTQKSSTASHHNDRLFRYPNYCVAVLHFCCLFMPPYNFFGDDHAALLFESCFFVCFGPCCLWSTLVGQRITGA